MLAHTLYGHMGSCNRAHFNVKGDMIASCDSLGVIKIWDIRKLSTIVSHDFGPDSINDIAFNVSSTLIAAASEDKSLKMYNILSQQVKKTFLVKIPVARVRQSVKLIFWFRSSTIQCMVMKRQFNVSNLI
jgi:WD40 repeat protein